MPPADGPALPPHVRDTLVREAGRRLASTREAALAAGRDPLPEYRRRARDYATWQLMGARPSRVDSLVTRVAEVTGHAPLDEHSHTAWAGALLEVLESLYREAAGVRAQPSGQ